MRNLMFALFMLSFSSIASAQTIAIHGLGLRTCGEAMQEIARIGAHSETGYSDWLGGFLTGYSHAILDVTHVSTHVGIGMSFDTLTALFKNKCAQAPTKLVIQIGKEIYEELGKAQ